MNFATVPRYPITIDGYTVGIGTANELSATLDVLQGQYDRVVLQQLSLHLADIIANPAGLMATLRSLVHADQVFLIKAIGKRLPEVVHSARYLSDIFAMLSSPDVEHQVLETLGKDGINTIVKTAADLADVLEWLYGRSDTKVLKLLGAERLQQLPPFCCHTGR